MNSINIFVIVFEKAWNANFYKCVIQEQLWALFKLRNVYFVLSKLQLYCYKRARVRHTSIGFVDGFSDFPAGIALWVPHG